MEYAQDALIIDSSILILSNVYATTALTLFLINVYQLVKRIKWELKEHVYVPQVFTLCMMDVTNVVQTATILLLI